MPDDLPLTDEQVGIVAWRIKCLTEVGIDADVAGDLASSNDWRRALVLKREGCPQKLILKILSD